MTFGSIIAPAGTVPPDPVLPNPVPPDPESLGSDETEGVDEVFPHCYFCSIADSSFRSIDC